MLFERRFLAGLADGSVTLTFRRWRRPQAVAGRRYRTPAGLVEVEAVDVVDPAGVTPAEARAAGYATAEELLADLRGDPEVPVLRVRFHAVDEADPREVLAATADLSAADVAELDRRLARLDRTGDSPWTAATLRAIEAHPGRRAGDLATLLGRERQGFKIDVRKLKALGLTVSLEVGYRLSPRGQAYLAAHTPKATG